MTNSFRARSTLTAGASSYEIWSLAALPQDKRGKATQGEYLCHKYG